MSLDQLRIHAFRRLLAVSLVICTVMQSISAKEGMSASESAAELANPSTPSVVLGIPLCPETKNAVVVEGHQWIWCRLSNGAFE